MSNAGKRYRAGYSEALDYKGVAENIRAFRLRSGLTRVQLTAVAKLPTASIYRWEAERHSPSLMNLELIARHLGVQVADFFSDESSAAIVAANYASRASGGLYVGARVQWRGLHGINFGEVTRLSELGARIRADGTPQKSYIWVRRSRVSLEGESLPVPPARVPSGKRKRNKGKRPRPPRNRFLARIAVRSALVRGNLKRLPCEQCGEPRSEAHHDDYAKHLDVRWLCREHHMEWHRLNGTGRNA